MARRGDFPEYVPVAKKKQASQKQIETLKKKHVDLDPVVIEGRTIAHSWWGKAWNTNLEQYADYSNRIARGRSYVRSGAVIDLKIETGVVKALVQGSERKPYTVEIVIAPLSQKIWESILDVSEHQIGSLAELVEGRFPKDFESLFQSNTSGLFPATKEITFNCTCYDWASMCKHVTAVLYGIGARLDDDPTLFFKLRAIDFEVLLQKTIEEKMQSMLNNADKKSDRVIEDEAVFDLFGL